MTIKQKSSENCTYSNGDNFDGPVYCIANASSSGFKLHSTIWIFGMSGEISGIFKTSETVKLAKSIKGRLLYTFSAYLIFTWLKEQPKQQQLLSVQQFQWK